MQLIKNGAGLFGTWVCCCVVASQPLAAHDINLPSSLLQPGDSVVTIATGITFGEGPATDSAGNLYFSDRNPSRIWKLPPDGTAEVFRNSANNANGMVVDRKGRLIVCEKNGISRIEADSTVTMMITADTLGDEGPNDLTLTSDGGIFFTSSVWNGDGRVFYLSPDGNLTTILSFSGPSLSYPNGIEYVEEKSLLYVNMTQKNTVEHYRVNEDMSVSPLGVWCSTPSPDGLALDDYGNLWVANTNGNHQVAVFDLSGRKLGEIIIDNQESVQNCAFGGPDLKTLYIAGKTAVYCIKTVVAGRSTTGITSVVRPRYMKSPDMGRYRNISEDGQEIFNLQGRRIMMSGIRSKKRVTSSDGMLVMRNISNKTACFPVLR